MAVEIERKFLLRDDTWRKSVVRHTRIRQAYLDNSAKVSIRVRIKDNNSATLTLKSRPSSLRRQELEYAIPVLEAEALLVFRQGLLIEKVRHIVPCGDLAWEIDVFSGENLGLVIAEIELPHESYKVDLPSWIGSEITGQAQYYNGKLADRPFCSWMPHDLAVATRHSA